VHPEFIRTFGENFIHVNEIDLFVEPEEQSGGEPPPPPSEEDVAAVEAICTQVAVELVNDGDTLQMGVGTVSAALGPFLDFRNDLGVQTELITGGIVDLVERGIVTGARKTMHPNKVVGSACVVMPQDELDRIHENPYFELYDFGYTDDLRLLIQQENFVAVNNALVIDLTGQVSAESLDHRPYTGVGGQTVFMLAGAYSKGGKSISVMPSSAIPSGTSQRLSRIVPSLGAGAAITVPRTYVDFVVTEHGIAELRGKTIAERANAMVEIAHPDFREELKAEARRMYHA
jgi:4-hydroxybutyrate CoA-transferase